MTDAVTDKVPQFWSGSAGLITSSKPLAERSAHDFYPTPQLLADVAINLLPNSFGTYPDILDPGAGTGVWGNSARQRWPRASVTGIEIRREARVGDAYNGLFHEDFLISRSVGWRDSFDLVIGNPPYNKAQEFVEQSLLYTRTGGYVFFLLRLAFLESAKRAKTLYAQTPPTAVYVLAERPSFTGNNKTDATAYAMFLWQKGVYEGTSLRWLSWKDPKKEIDNG